MQISDKTTIGLFSALGAMIFVGGLIIWAARVEAKVDAVAKDSTRHEKEIAEQSKMFVEIRERLIRIETNLSKGK